jgi:hypothetical protein
MAVTTIPAPQSLVASRRSDRRGFAVARAGALATVTAAAATELFGLVARAAGVPMRAADPGAAAAKAIPVGGLFMAVVMNAAVGIVLAVVLVRVARRPAKLFAVIASTYAVLSLLGPALATHTTLATKVVLGVAHVLAAAVIIPQVANRLHEVGARP